LNTVVVMISVLSSHIRACRWFPMQHISERGTADESRRCIILEVVDVPQERVPEYVGITLGSSVADNVLHDVLHIVDHLANTSPL
jgi:hypothetical protein